METNKKLNNANEIKIGKTYFLTAKEGRFSKSIFDSEFFFVPTNKLWTKASDAGAFTFFEVENTEGVVVSDADHDIYEI
jgi:hypothetical protein